MKEIRTKRSLHSFRLELLLKELNFTKKRYIDKPRQLTLEDDFCSYRSLRAKVSWCTNTIFNICFAIVHFAHVSVTNISENPKLYLREINKMHDYLLKSSGFSLKLSKLRLLFLKLLMWADASYTSSSDCAPQIGNVVFLQSVEKEMLSSLLEIV